ncbi:hypothetical protein Val02_91230 [Virgisporangium aliadipatigenens]|uniref:Polyketide cyclase / dehydrase and lipid transport n=1 Tax=Virgisporangium aliadipatigenens TaxID=741659 RepID=A0A8J3YXA3_9ACTN|nr:hypothetical protein [Virgisporangium aliadipatigenens]GIJ52237.1 hypothetical protein Val02_91230 [Virgisporangium aliadipatigenens]
MSARQTTVRMSVELDVPDRVAFERICRIEDHPQYRTGVLRVQTRSETEFRGELAESVFTARIRRREPDHLLHWQTVTGPTYEEIVTVEPVSTLRSRIIVEATGPGDLMSQLALDVIEFKRAVERDHPHGGHHANELPPASFRHRSNWRDGLLYGRTGAGEPH